MEVTSLMDLLLSQPSASDRFQQIAPLIQGGRQPAPFADMGGAVGGGPRGWVQQALDITNSPDQWLKPLMQLMGRESGGDPRAYNDTPVASGQHAQGLFQTIPSTFEAHNIDRLGGIYNPVANAVAAIRYIKSRYGSPFNLPSSGGY